MPKVIANNYETHYELDDFTDPWKPAETIVIQHGLGRSSRFWYHWGLCRKLSKPYYIEEDIIDNPTRHCI
jgi:hypothetical protein